jgi:hypothetical protein
MSEREWYYISDTTPEASQIFWDVALDFLHPHLYLAYIDLFPDLSWGGHAKLTGPEVPAYEFLRSVSRPIDEDARKKRTWTAEQLDLTHDETFEAYKVYGYRSIQTSVYRRDEPPESAPSYPEEVAAIENHDSGYSIRIRMSTEELHQLRLLADEKGLSSDALEKWEPKPKRRWFRRHS